MIDSCSIESNGLLSIDQALEKIKNSITPPYGAERLVLKDAIGRVLDQTVYSAINIPSERNSAMDGYAYSSADIKPNQSCTLTLAGTSWAGKPFTGQCLKNQCIRIFTGAVMPDNTDSVIMQEHIKIQGDKITFPADTVTKQNVRHIACDIAKGEKLISPPKKLSAIDIGLLASAGIYDVAVKPKLNIAFLSTGDELCSISQPLNSGQIYDSNRYTLSGLLNNVSFVVDDLGVVPDDKAILKETLLSAAQSHDVIITTGGASVGEADYIKEILDECGHVNFWKIAIKPGKPLAFGKINHCYFFGLPGNPVSVIATFHKIVQPALDQLTGIPATKPLSLIATCTSHLKKQKGRQEYQRGILSQNKSGEFYVESAGEQGSNIMSAMSRANCYIVLPIDSEGVSIGEHVSVEPFNAFI